MKTKYLSPITCSAMILSLMVPVLGEAGNVKKTYVNVAKEGAKAQVSDIPANYGQVETKLKTVAYNAIEGKQGSYQGSTYKKVEGPPALGQAISMNESTAVNDNLVWAGVPSSFPTKQLTLEFWMNPKKKSFTQYYFSYASSGGYENDWLMSLGTNLTMGMNLKNSYGIGFSGLTLEEGKWTHVAITWDSNTGIVNVYKNGNPTPVYRNTNFAKGLSLGTGGTMMFGQEQDCIGGCYDPGQIFAGQVDELRVWNVVRTPEEITKNFNRSITPQSGLAGYWTFE